MVYLERQGWCVFPLFTLIPRPDGGGSGSCDRRGTGRTECRRDRAPDESRRERMVMVEPRGTEMVLITLRAAHELRGPQFSETDGARSMLRCWPLPARSSSDVLAIPSKQVPRPLPEGVAGADRGQNEGAADQAASGSDTRAGDRSDGGSQT
jgi:hypothetical protein